MTGTRGSYQRVLLKLSGEVFGGGKGVGLDPDVLVDVAKQIADVVRGGVQVAIVVGGGNFFRGAELSERGMQRARADYMGMLGTVMNCLALQDFLEREVVVGDQLISVNGVSFRNCATLGAGIALTCSGGAGERGCAAQTRSSATVKHA